MTPGLTFYSRFIRYSNAFSEAKRPLTDSSSNYTPANHSVAFPFPPSAINFNYNSVHESYSSDRTLEICGLFSSLCTFEHSLQIKVPLLVLAQEGFSAPKAL
jgi:hypothetical protein